MKLCETVSVFWWSMRKWTQVLHAVVSAGTRCVSEWQVVAWLHTPFALGNSIKRKHSRWKDFFVLYFLSPREKASESVFVYSHPGDVSDLTAHSYKRGRTPSPLSSSLPLSILPSLLFLQQIGLHLGHKSSLAVWLEINNSNEDNLLKSLVQYCSFSICLRPAKHSDRCDAAGSALRSQNPPKGNRNACVFVSDSVWWTTNMNGTRTRGHTDVLQYVLAHFHQRN